MYEKTLCSNDAILYNIIDNYINDNRADNPYTLGDVVRHRSNDNVALLVGMVPGTSNYFSCTAPLSRNKTYHGSGIRTGTYNISKEGHIRCSSGSNCRA